MRHAIAPKYIIFKIAIYFSLLELGRLDGT